MKKAIISIGGSIIVPEDVDYKFLKSLKKAILGLKKYKIIICTGGGHTARDYIRVLKKEKLNEYTQDIIGIEATRLNAKLVSSFLEKTNKEIPLTLEEVADASKVHKIVICGGLTPGQTSDGTTAMIADYMDADVLINVTNVDGLFDKDPRKFKNAKFISKISHADLKKMMEKIEKKPGMHFVLDHQAAEICRKANIDIVILKGVDNLKKFLEGKKFKGTLVS